MKKIVAIKRSDNDVTWLSGPMDFGMSVQNYEDGETMVDHLFRQFGVETSPSILERPTKQLWLQTRKGQDVFFPVDKIESVELRDYNEDSYKDSCGG